MEKRKILLLVSGILIVIGIAICLFVAVTNSFKCNCKKSDDECKIVEEHKEENNTYEGTIIDMELDLAYPVTFVYNVIDSLDTSLGSLDLAIKGKYLLIVDGEFIWLDDFNGYAMYHNDIVGLNDQTLRIISRAFKPYENGECCSCCPDLKPGESCIALCCPCN